MHLHYGSRRRPVGIIVDMDGTLVDVQSIRHYILQQPRQFDRFHSESINCPPNQDILKMVHDMHASRYRPLIVTARHEKWRAITEAWLIKHLPGIPWQGPFMRADGDYRKAPVVKQEILTKLRKTWNIAGAIDDDPAVIEMWKSEGLTTVTAPGWHVPDPATGEASA
jgi:hypothetical protein